MAMLRTEKNFNSENFRLYSISLVHRPFEEEKGPGTHCMRMRKVYGEFSSIIHGIPLLPRGWTRYTKHPKSVFYINRCVKLAARYFERLLYGRFYSLSSHFKQTFLGFKDQTNVPSLPLGNCLC